MFKKKLKTITLAATMLASLTAITQQAQADVIFEPVPCEKIEIRHCPTIDWYSERPPVSEVDCGYIVDNFCPSLPVIEPSEPCGIRGCDPRDDFFDEPRVY